MQCPDVIYKITPVKIREIMEGLNTYTSSNILPIHVSFLKRDTPSFHKVITFPSTSAIWICSFINKTVSLETSNMIVNFYSEAIERISYKLYPEVTQCLIKNKTMYILLLFLTLGDMSFLSIKEHIHKPFNKEHLNDQLFNILIEMKLQIEKNLTNPRSVESFKDCLNSICQIYKSLHHLFSYRLFMNMTKLTTSLQYQSFVHPMRKRILLIKLLPEKYNNKIKDILYNSRTPRLYLCHKELDLKEKINVRPEMFLYLLNELNDININLPELNPGPGLNNLINELEIFRKQFWFMDKHPPNYPQKKKIKRPCIKCIKPENFTYLDLLKQKLSLMYTYKWEWIWMLMNNKWYSKHPEVRIRLKLVKAKISSLTEIQDLRGLILWLFGVS